MTEVLNWKEEMEKVAAILAPVKPLLAMCVKESNEAANAFVIGSFKGEAGREEAMGHTTGPKWPERTAFELGLILGPVGKAWLMSLVVEDILPLVKKALLEFLKGLLKK